MVASTYTKIALVICKKKPEEFPLSLQQPGHHDFVIKKFVCIKGSHIWDNIFVVYIYQSVIWDRIICGLHQRVLCKGQPIDGPY